MAAPDPILEAAHILVREESSGTCEFGKACLICDCNQPESDGRAKAIASAVVAAVRPLIEAEVREQVARDFDAMKPNWWSVTVAGRPFPVVLTAQEAARIARGAQ